MSTYNVYPSWIRRFEKNNKIKIEDLLGNSFLRMQVNPTNRKIILQEAHFLKHGKALFVSSMEEFGAIEHLQCDKVSFDELLTEDLDMIVACPVESGIAPYIFRICMSSDIEREYGQLYRVTGQQLGPNEQRYCMITVFQQGKKKSENYYLQYNFPLEKLNEHINNGVPMIDAGSLNVTTADEEMERRVISFTAKLLMFMKAAPELFRNGLPQIMLQHTKLMEGRPKITFKLPPADWKNSHYRRMHVRQLWADRYYQGEYSHMLPGQRMIIVKATVVKRITKDENNVKDD